MKIIYHLFYYPNFNGTFKFRTNEWFLFYFMDLVVLRHVYWSTFWFCFIDFLSSPGDRLFFFLLVLDLPVSIWIFASIKDSNSIICSHAASPSFLKNKFKVNFRHPHRSIVLYLLLHPHGVASSFDWDHGHASVGYCAWRYLPHRHEFLGLLNVSSFLLCRLHCRSDSARKRRYLWVRYLVLVKCIEKLRTEARSINITMQRWYVCLWMGFSA